MGNQKMSGLIKRGGIWHIDKQFRGARICESTGTGDVRQAQEYLAKRINELRETRLIGVRESRSFRAAATKYLEAYDHKRGIADDALHLRLLDTFIGGLELKQVHMGNLREFTSSEATFSVEEAATFLRLTDVTWRKRCGRTSPHLVQATGFAQWLTTRQASTASTL